MDPNPDFAKLAGIRLQGVRKDEYSWHFYFDSGASLRADGLWRLVEGGRVVRTSRDHGERFGLPAPVDCVKELEHRLINARLQSAKVGEGPADLMLHFDNGCTLQCLIDSGYVSWTLSCPSPTYFTAAGGELTSFP